MRLHIVLALAFLGAALAGCAAPNAPGSATESTNPSATQFEPAPRGDGLDAAEIQRLVLAFDDQPLSEGQTPWPGHLIKWVNEETFVLLHFDHEDPQQATELLWMGLGVRGVFCDADQPGPEFTHFHRFQADSYAEGHGGAPGELGYWLQHNNVQRFESPFGDTGAPGHHAAFGPTPVPDCDDRVPASFDPPGSDGLDALELQRLKEAFDDEPLRGGQEPWPSHLLKWVTPETFVLLHFDTEEIEAGSTMLWAGIGTRGIFCDTDQPGPEFTHFHRSHAPTYAEGHGGAPGQPGYWLMHNNVLQFESPFGDTGRPGIHETFGVTPPPSC